MSLCIDTLSQISNGYDTVRSLQSIHRLLLLRTDPIIDPSLCLLKEGVFSFRFGLKSIVCSTHNKSAKRFAFDKLNDPLLASKECPDFALVRI
jgi:hypothetical protein